jgi:hypothetical protein
MLRNKALESYVVVDDVRISLRRVDSIQFDRLEDQSSKQKGIPMFFNYSLTKGIRFFPPADKEYDLVIFGVENHATNKG